MRSTDIDSMFTHAEWDLLVRLPGRVVVAAAAADADGPRRTMAEALAGLDAIAAGRQSPNPLVRTVVGAIYAERDTGRAMAGSSSAERPDRATTFAQVLVTCRQAAAMLAERASPEDRRAYERWVESIAVRMWDAAQPRGQFSGAAQITNTERRFLAEMADAFQ